MSSEALLNSCQSILNQVRRTNLNFSVQETPFSIYLTVRKTFVKSRSLPDIPPVILLDDVSEHLQSKHTHLKIEHEKVKESLKESLDKNKTKTSNIAKLEEKIRDLHAEIGRKADLLNSAETKMIDNNRVLQTKHEKVCAENKNLKYENEDLKKEINNLNIASKSAKKEVKETSHRLGKNIEVLEDKVKSLLDFKIIKEAEEKGLKTKMKKAEKKMKLAREREAEVEIEKITLSKQRKEFDDNNNTVKAKPEDFTDTKDYDQNQSEVPSQVDAFNNFDCSNLLIHLKI